MKAEEKERGGSVESVLCVCFLAAVSRTVSRVYVAEVVARSWIDLSICVSSRKNYSPHLNSSLKAIIDSSLRSPNYPPSLFNLETGATRGQTEEQFSQ